MTTKVTIEPGICGFTCSVVAETNDDDEIELSVASGCASVSSMFVELGTVFDPFDLCLQKPGTGPFYEYAQTHFPSHSGCPTIAGILKAVEVEAQMALPKDATIHFE